MVVTCVAVCCSLLQSVECFSLRASGCKIITRSQVVCVAVCCSVCCSVCCTLLRCVMCFALREPGRNTVTRSQVACVAVRCSLLQSSSSPPPSPSPSVSLSLCFSFLRYIYSLSSTRGMQPLRHVSFNDSFKFVTFISDTTLKYGDSATRT